MTARDPNAYDETVVRECMARWKGWSEDDSLGSLFEVHVYRHIKAQAARIAELEAELAAARVLNMRHGWKARVSTVEGAVYGEDED